MPIPVGLHLLLLLLLSCPCPPDGASAMGNNCGRATLQLDTKTSLHKCTLFGGKLKPKGECPLQASPRMRHTNPSQTQRRPEQAVAPAAPTSIARLFCKSARLHPQAVSHLLSTSKSLQPYLTICAYAYVCMHICMYVCMYMCVPLLTAQARTKQSPS